MTLGEYCNREVIVMHGDESVKTAARLMREHHVGDVVLVTDRNGRRVPTGIVTDRDLVVEVLAQDLVPDDLAVGDIVTEPPYLAREDDDLFDALEMMRSHGIRRVPVVDADRNLVGIITVDDAIELLAEISDDLAAVVERQPAREATRRP